MGNSIADALNRDCYCIGVNRQALRDRLSADLRDSGVPEKLLDANSHLFAMSPVFLGHEHLHAMERLIQAVETVVKHSAYRQAVLAAAAVPMLQDLGPSGVFFAYDFHLGADGPQLIEINTNAGAVLLNLYLAAAQQACCEEVVTFFGGKTDFAAAENELIAMFRKEWSSQRPDRELRSIAIVDRDPPAQFLYPEFLLFQSLFARHGIDTVIVDARDLVIDGDLLCAHGRAIDLVYNRLTDFYLLEQESATLRAAWQRGLAVLTPSPLHYALYADKRNLPLLSDADRLRAFGIDEDTIATLGHSLPETLAVTPGNAAQLWSNRKRYFFKPATGYGSRGAYRGAKLTKRVWHDIIHADYIAQAMVPPSERQLLIGGKKESLKLDIRCITYEGRIQQLSARLYQGQTTNLRTQGGGLATVFPTPGGNCCCQ
ncbi:MAG: hypothetical protein OEW64_01640 [Gammaproteobacteria bacterium]|nr:hypothetical protein [Gammaproteobacteria bacterium]